MFRCMGKEALTLKITMKLTVIKSKPSSFPSHKEFQNAMAALLNYPPPHRLVRLCVCVYLGNLSYPVTRCSGNIYHIMC